MFGWGKVKRNKEIMTPVDTRGGWYSIIKEPFSGAWQQNIAYSQDCILAFSAVYACITLIASDIAKLPINLVEQDDDGIWTQTKNTKAPTIVKPNAYQNRIRFFEQWLISKLVKGNAYIWKERRDGKIVALYVLDPCRVTPLITEDGDVYYQIKPDNVNGIKKELTVPASEIIHDLMPALFHPLVGTSPIFACGLAASQGLRIQKNSEKFFANMSVPGGILAAPGPITPDNAKKLKDDWEANYSGKNAGRVAVVGDGMTYTQMTLTAVEAQLIEQLKWTAQDVCSCFHVPAYKVGFGTMPTYNNAEIFNNIYYSDCLQSHIESIELCLDEGLELPQTDKKMIGTQFDLDALLRMDTDTRYKGYGEAISKGWMKPNEARKREDLKPVTGGDTPYLQQQNFSLAALAARDKKGPAPSKLAPDGSALPDPSPAPEPAPAPEPKKEFSNVEFIAALEKNLNESVAA